MVDHTIIVIRCIVIQYIVPMVHVTPIPVTIPLIQVIMIIIGIKSGLLVYKFGIIKKVV